MKVCPLISQAVVLEGDKDVLLGETESTELDSSNEEKRDEDIFINPDITHKKDNKKEIEVRFVAKSFKGDVKCIEETCRFYDADEKVCKFEKLLNKDEAASGTREAIESIREELERSKEQLQRLEALSEEKLSSLTEKLGSLSEKHDGLEQTADESKQKTEELDKNIQSLKEEIAGSVDQLKDLMNEKMGEIENKIESGSKDMLTLRDSVTEWKNIISKNIDAMESELEGNKVLIEKITSSHEEILKVVERQKQNLEQEEKKRLVSESRRLNNSGVIAYHNGQYEKALELFKKAIELNPEFTEGYNNLGLTYTELKDEEKATEAFKKAIELDPDLSATYNNLGYAFYRMGSYEEAIEMYNEAIGRSKDNSSAYTNLGNAYYKLNRIEEAIEAWKKALEIDPGNEKAQRNLKKFHIEIES